VSKVEVKIVGDVCNDVLTIASEIAQALRLLGFKITTCGDIKGKTSNRVAQTERVRVLTSSEHNHIKITCEQLHQEKVNDKNKIRSK
jgi:phage FluMu protein gp41